MDFLQTIFIAICALSGISLAAEDDLFYPYGNETDLELLRTDDIGIEVTIARDFPYFDSNHRSLFVNDNGILSFLKLVDNYEADPFPLGDNRRLIAPYWADVDISKGEGSVFYREITNDQDLFDRATAEVLRVFGGELGLKKFTTKWLFITTWHEVPYFITTGVTGRYNTFQTVLITDGLLSFAMFNYGRLEWTTGLSSFGQDGLASGNDSVAAQVGFNAGDGINFYSVAGSRTNEILEINSTSNIGRDGRWMFRVDLTDIKPGGCYDDIDELLINPKIGSMLGGDVLYISGPCFDETKDIMCLVDGVEIPTSYDQANPFTVRCTLPTTLKVGVTSVSLSTDGGNTYPHAGSIQLLNLNQMHPLITFSISDDVLDFSWPVDNFPYLDSIPGNVTVNLSLYTYQEKSSVRRNIADDIMLKKLVTIATDIPLTRAGYQIYLPSLPVKGFDVGLLHIEEHSEAPSTELKPSMWSLPFNLNPSTSQSASLWCNEWARTAEGVDPTDDIPPCPCTLTQALADSTWFDADPFCKIGSPLASNCADRLNAVHCVTARLPSTNGHGNRCCYSADGYIIHLEDDTSGGSQQLYHQSGAVPYSQVGQIPFLSNYLWDLIPWHQCCVRSSNSHWCNAYVDKRPSDQCLYYNTPEPATIFGEPHIVTFDNAQFTFNELGEFWLMRSEDAPAFEIQGRLQPFNKSATQPGTTGTSLTAFVVKYTSSTTYIQVVLSERRTMDLMVWEEGKREEWQLIDFFEWSWWRLNGVTVSSSSPSEILIQYDNGISAKVEVHSNSTAMALLVLVPETFKQQVSGILGSWNDNPLDDNVMLTEFAITAPESFFFYDGVTNHTTYNQPGFVPISTPSSTLTDDQVEMLCEDSKACAYDYKKTQDPNIAKGTKDAEDDYDVTDFNTTDVGVCPRLDAPFNGNKYGTVYLEGKRILFTCNEGLTLTGSEIRTCTNGTWTGEETFCKDEAEALSSKLLFPLVIVAIALFVIIFIIILIMYCRIRLAKKHLEVIEMDPTHLRGPSIIPDSKFDEIETPEEDRKTTMVVPIASGSSPDYAMLDDHKNNVIDNDYMSVRNGKKPVHNDDDDEDDDIKKKASAEHIEDSESEDEIAVIKNNFKAEDQLMSSANHIPDAEEDEIDIIKDNFRAESELTT